jgi:hypothetical protein
MKALTWRFVSRASADMFAASPAAEVPRFNGFFANALSTGEGLVRTDCQVWEFFGDKLFLFYGEAGRQRWLKGLWQPDEREADQAWQVNMQKRQAVFADASPRKGSLNAGSMTCTGRFREFGAGSGS